MPLKTNYFLNETDERGQRYTAIHMGKNLAEQLWDFLDAGLDELTATKIRAVDSSETMHKRDEDVAELKGLCRAFSTALSTMLQHYYPTPLDVTKEAVKRSKMRLEKIEWQPTPGYNYNPPPIGTKAYESARKLASGDGPSQKKTTSGRASQITSTGASAAKPSRKSFSEAEVVGIRNARDSGLLTISALAETFKISEEEIRAL